MEVENILIMWTTTNYNNNFQIKLNNSKKFYCYNLNLLGYSYINLKNIK